MFSAIFVLSLILSRPWWRFDLS